MIKREHQRKKIPKTKDGKLRIDQIDRNILEILKANSRESCNELGKRLYLSPEAVRRRIKQLISSGIIIRFTIEIDQEKLE